MIPETREEEGKEFSEKIKTHVANYTVPQYGEKGEDNVTFGSTDKLMSEIYKYYSRHGKNQREGQDELDLMKIAHYACMCYGKLKNEEDKEKDEKISGTKEEIIEIIQDFDPEKTYIVEIKEK